MCVCVCVCVCAFTYALKSLFFFSEVHSGFFYKSASERGKLVAAERKFVDDRVQQVIDLKKQVRQFTCWKICQLVVYSYNIYKHIQVCNGSNKTFVVINQKVI